MAVLLVTAFLLPFTFDSVFAETYIDETNSIISTNTIWTKDISPYIVYQDMLVEKGVILTIEAGTIIKFESGRYLNILGEVIVQGTESDFAKSRRVVSIETRRKLIGSFLCCVLKIDFNKIICYL